MKTIYTPRYAQLIETLVTQRKNLGYTQLQLATHFNKPQSFVAKIETLERKIDVLEFVTMCELLNLDPSKLIMTLCS